VLSASILFWCLATSAVSVYALGTQQGIPRLDALGRWNLEKLGSEPFELGVPNSSAGRSLPFFVPEKTAEEPGVDFLINLRLSLRLARDSGAGFGIFNVFVNGEAGEQITVEATRNEKGVVRGKWSTADLFFGPRSEAFQSDRAEIDVRNFTPLPGIKAGLNEFSVEFERGENIAFAEALVKKATGIEITHARPPELKVEPELPRDKVVKGVPFEVKFRLQNTGTVPARRVSVRLESSAPKLLAVEGSDSFSFDRLLTEKVVSFRARGKEYGAYKLVLNVISQNANSPLAVIEAPIARGEGHRDGIPWGPIGLAVGLIALAGWGARRLLIKDEH
jgi:hypothetical protein